MFCTYPGALPFFVQRVWVVYKRLFSAEKARNHSSALVLYIMFFARAVMQRQRIVQTERIEIDSHGALSIVELYMLEFILVFAIIVMVGNLVSVYWYPPETSFRGKRNR